MDPETTVASEAPEPSEPEIVEKSGRSNRSELQKKALEAARLRAAEVRKKRLEEKKQTQALPEAEPEVVYRPKKKKRIVVVEESSSDEEIEVRLPKRKERRVDTREERAFTREEPPSPFRKN